MDKNKANDILISIVIATYNAELTLDKCLDSIVPQLTDKCELIIIDGDSDDNTYRILKSYDEYISYSVSEPDNGIYDAWNKGIRVAKGEWIAFIGADDVLLPGAIEAYCKIIDNTSGINSYDYICAHIEYVDVNGKLLKVLGEEPKWSVMKKRMAPAHVASLHNKKNLFETIGYYDYEHFRICADYELLLRKKNKLKYLMIPNHIAQMRVGGMSFSTKAIIEAYRIRRTHHSIPLIVNKWQLFRDWATYKFFILKKEWGKV